MFNDRPTFVLNQVSDGNPLTWWGKFPVYGTTCLVLAHCVCFLLTTAALPLGGAAWVSGLTFSNQAVLGQFAIWQVATYAFVHVPSLWFLIEMAMLYFFGTEVEKVLGRRQFFTFYGLLILLPPLFLVAAGLFGPVLTLQGASAIQMGIFLAFVSLYPNLPFFFAIPAKWVWAAFFLLNSFLGIAGTAWAPVSALWLNTLATLFFLRAVGLPWPFSLPAISASSRESFPSTPREEPRKKKPRPTPRRQSDPIESIDPILEKIARSGLSSLTPTEKSRLEKARAQLLAQEKNS